MRSSVLQIVRLEFIVVGVFFADDVHSAKKSLHYPCWLHMQ